MYIYKEHANTITDTITVIITKIDMVIWLITHIITYKRQIGIGQYKSNTISYKQDFKVNLESYTDHKQDTIMDISGDNHSRHIK